MGKAVRETCRPLLYELGFRHPRVYDRDRWYATRRDVFLLWRGVDLNQIQIKWARWNRPAFRISFQKWRFERDVDGKPTEFRWSTTGAVCVRKRGKRSYIEWFGPWQSIQRAVELASTGLLELDGYFVHGVVGPHVWVGISTRIGPGLDPPQIPPWWRRFGDPALDPESDVRRSD